MTSVGSPLVWAVFVLVVVVALAIDLGVFNREARPVRMRDAAIWVAVWCSLGLAFNLFVWRRFGGHKGLEFLQGWLLEVALSADNVFVFLVILSYFKVSRDVQHKVLFWGILGAVISRGAFIGAGAATIHAFHWVLYLLGAFLVFTSIKILAQEDKPVDPSRNLVLRLFRRLVPITPDYVGARFFARHEGRMMATPLLAVLVVVEAADVMFAVDSIPAIFGVTTDVFIVFTSNIFAVLGLRSLFFLVAGLAQKLVYLKYAISAILAFIGIKIMAQPLFEIPVSISLVVVVGLLAVATAVSLLFGPKSAN
jgi:tellurite resistance protein TerC